MSNEITNINTAIPKIYKAICNVIGDVGAVGKDKKNEQQNYRYRAIDDVYNALNPALAKYGVLIVPNVLEVTKVDRATKSGAVMTYATVRVNYTFYCAEDGSSVNSEVQGEGSDTGDKSINKAMSAAMKYMCFQVFCIPTEELNEDADKAGLATPVKSNADYVKESYQRRKDYALSTGTNSNDVISEAQARLLFAKSNKDIVKKVIGEYGYEHTTAIKKKDFDEILKKVVDEMITANESAEAAITDDDIPFDGELPFNMGEASA